jgi:RNA polymerase primary sigma factor
MSEPTPPEVEEYLRAVMAVPSLTPDEERELWQAIKSEGDGEAAKKRVIEASLKLVIPIARNYEGRGLPFADLCQEGILGLMRAVERFDPSRDRNFTPFANDWINFSIVSAVG